jgi:hypothetical protein
MLEGACLCGAAGWTLDQTPSAATACSCTACRRYGTLWAYGHEGEDLHLRGATTAFTRGESLSFNFCPTCGNVTHWHGFGIDAQGRRRSAVNLRLAEPDAVAAIPIRHFDGFDTWTSLPSDGKCVKDLWF